MIKDKPLYKAIYQAELAEELTGKSIETIRKRMKRNKLTLAETIKLYLNEN